ncbi:ROK family protein [Longimycelium tulufanense]|uniref:ROK family protein n=1 Tax=Longimycelium tulufanense TaxID=907463 RepID=UPI001E59B56C|nr:ROK family protein [Longimycelium tulufanense]
MTGRWAIGVDVGGTKIATALVSEGGELTARTAVPTPVAGGARAVLAAIEAQARHVAGQLATGTVLVGLGIGTGGVVDHSRGVVLSATDLLPGWAGLALADELGQRLGTRVYVDNDGNTLALGEHRFGAGRGLRDVIYATVGTGIGGGIVLGGRLRRGASHSAGELGHVPAPQAVCRRCSCGRTGHVEAAAAGPAMTDDYRRRSGDMTVCDLRVIAERAGEGDEVAAAVLAGGASTFGQALAGLVNVVDPEAVVVGGGVADIGQLFWAPMEEALRESTLPGPSRVQLKPALLGTAAPLVGAAMLAIDPEPEGNESPW